MNASRFASLWLVLLLGAGLLGCGPEGAVDAGSGADAGARDAGGGADAGNGLDSGSGEDAGVDVDAGIGEDAGNDSDSGSRHDGGFPIDAGEGEDAGRQVDAGSGEDAGSHADGGNPLDAGSADDGGGGCAVTSCAPYLCDAEGVACLSSCSDDDACVEGHFCDDGVCQRDLCLTECGPDDDDCQSAPVDCNDANPCTVDGCDPALGCFSTASLADGAACDDGIACTDGEFCLAGVCGNGASNCVSASLCEPSVCDEGTGQCSSAPVECPASSDPYCFDRQCSLVTGTCYTILADDRTCDTNECELDSECSDSNECTVDSCQGGDGIKLCTFTAKTCDDGSAITIDYCSDPAVGCQWRLQDPAVFCDDGIACTHDSWDFEQGACVNTPMASLCDDEDESTEDVCDVELGECTNLGCPVGLTDALGACWLMSDWDFVNGQAGTGTGCDVTCSGVGLQYSEATRAIAGSDGTDANCRAVLAALGNDDKDLEIPSASCAAGLGCFVDVDFAEQQAFHGHGRCVTPATDATSKQAWIRRACACE